MWKESRKRGAHVMKEWKTTKRKMQIEVLRKNGRGDNEEKWIEYEMNKYKDGRKEKGRW